MKQLSSLILSLALVLSISLPGRAEILKNLKTDGSIEFKTFGIDNETDRDGSADDYRSEARTRLMAGATWDLLDDVHARVSIFKRNRVYGGGSENLNTVQSALFVDNAYVKIDKVFGHVDLTLGRQFYGAADDLVIGFTPTPDDVLTVNAVDVVRVDSNIGNVAAIQGIAGKIADTGATGATLSNADTDLFGAEVNTDKLIPQGNLAAYYYTRKIKDPATALGNDTLNMYGARLRGMLLAALGYHAEAVANGGRNSRIAGTPGYDGSAYFLGLNFGQNVAQMPVRAKFEYGRGSNNFRDISSNKRFGKIWGEHSSLGTGPSSLNRASSTGLQGIKVVDLGVGVNVIEKLGIDLNAYRFWYDARMNVVGGKTNVGTEYDLIVSWKHSDNVSLEASAATFQVGDALDNTGGTATSPITRLGADVKIKF